MFDSLAAIIELIFFFIAMFIMSGIFLEFVISILVDRRFLQELLRDIFITPILKSRQPPPFAKLIRFVLGFWEHKIEDKHSIVDLIVKEKTSSFVMSFRILFPILLVSAIVSESNPANQAASTSFEILLYNYKWVYSILSVACSILIISLATNYFVTIYRVKKHYYGINDYEAKEIATFILKNSSEHDFPGGGGGSRRIYPETEVVEVEQVKIGDTKGMPL
jgi:hypothetical protein